MNFTFSDTIAGSVTSWALSGSSPCIQPTMVGRSLYRNDFSDAGNLPSFGSLDNGRLLVGNSTAGVLGVPGPDDWALVRHEFALPAGEILSCQCRESAFPSKGVRCPRGPPCQ